MYASDTARCEACGRAALILLGLVQTIRAGNEMAPAMRAIHSWGNRLSERLFGPA